MTKPITAVGIMILMEDGKLGLNDAIEKYLPEFKSTTRKTQGPPNPITIHHLLTHTSGLSFSRPQELEGITIKRDRTLADVATILSKQPLEFEPGAQHMYASPGFAVLGRLIEVVSAQPYEHFIKERVFDALGMRDSFFFIPAGKQSRVATVYRQQADSLKRWEDVERYRKNAKYPGPEFGMYSTATDLLAFCQMVLDGGIHKGKRILSTASVEAMLENHTRDIKSAVTGRAVYQGLGWGLSGDPMNDPPLASPGSFGHDGAFGTLAWVDPKRELIRIFLIQRSGFGNEGDIFMALAASALLN